MKFSSMGGIFFIKIDKNTMKSMYNFDITKRLTLLVSVFTNCAPPFICCFCNEETIRLEQNTAANIGNIPLTVDKFYM